MPTADTSSAPSSSSDEFMTQWRCHQNHVFRSRKACNFFVDYPHVARRVGHGRSNHAPTVAVDSQNWETIPLNCDGCVN